MTLVSLDPQNSLPLVHQITDSIRESIDARAIRSGTRMPSIRQFASDHGVSRFTVVQAYDKLVAMGYLISRLGSGFYVASRPQPRAAMEGVNRLDGSIDVAWLLRNALENRDSKTMPCAWWPPAAWMEESGIRKSLRALSLRQGEFFTAYGTPAGYQPLRELVQGRLAAIGVTAETSQIVLTSGVTHAMDLITRYFLHPGDVVLVDDPGFFILFGGLESFGARIVGVPWNHDGPDIPTLEALIKEHRPRMFFTNTVLHNPTGVSISQSVAYRMLQLAEKYDVILVEDDIYGDFHPAKITRLATLDQLDRVIYVSSFSKSLSASLRVGYFACNRKLVGNLCDMKLLTGLTTSEVSERVIYQVLSEGHYRKHMDKLRLRLQEARTTTIARLEKLGFSIYAEPEGGMFIWAGLNGDADMSALAARAARGGVMLAPGSVFRPHQEASPWLRFNVAHCEDETIFSVLADAVAAGAKK
ncbi:MAG: PLP-dependent aminotransferase family protein [Gallionellaceae bacterium]|jgi:DNA-binding transcriptional MocR family regulator|nr:PLP-dependent aminotransferase family protein [Gallionellaceae bacterium]